MTRNTRRVLVVWALAAVLAPAALACTAAVILGSATADGRPLLWKNRDTGTRDNEIVRFAPREIDGRTTLAFVGVTNAGGTLPWGGLNEAGFAIINTLTPDMRTDGARGQGNGSFMRDALRWCRSVEDFEAQLDRTAGKRSTIATFSVIDAHGRGVTYEVGPDRHVAFDAADPEVAEASCAAGVVVRSNFTFTANGLAPGERATGIASTSFRRFGRAEELLGDADENAIDLRFMFEQVMRDHDGDEGARLLDTRETISRRTTVSGILIQGVRPGEDPRTATMWVMLGEPSLSIAVPAWAAMERTSPVADGPETSPLCDAAELLRARVYRTADGGPRFDLALLPAIHEDTLVAEREIVAAAARGLERWRTSGVDPSEMERVHREACERALGVLRSEASAAARPTAAKQTEPAGGDPAGSGD
ncbi:MAG: peptidase C45 [Phycisphaerales bacterium JB054]